MQTPLRFIVAAFVVDYRGNVTLILRYQCFIAAILPNSWAIKYVVAPSQHLLIWMPLSFMPYQYEHLICQHYRFWILPEPRRSTRYPETCHSIR